MREYFELVIDRLNNSDRITVSSQRNKFSIFPSILTTKHQALKEPVVRGRKNPGWQGFAGRFYDCRAQLNWPLRMIQSATGITIGSLSRYEDGLQQPQIDSVELIAYAFGVPACWLAFGAEGMEVFRSHRPRAEPLHVPSPPTPGSMLMEYRAAGFAERLAAYRQQSGLALRPLAQAAGVSHEAVSRLERGQHIPSLDTAFRLAVALGVAPCQLAYNISAPAVRTARPIRMAHGHSQLRVRPRTPGTSMGKAWANCGQVIKAPPKNPTED